MTETAKEYATALFELAKETNEEKQFSEALKVIQTAFQTDLEYLDLLSSPNIPLNERRTILEKAFADHVPEFVLSFTELLCDKGHIREFDRCVKEYEKMEKAFESLSTARVVSTIPLTDEQKTALIKKLEKMSGHIVAAEYEIDETLLGGVVVHMDDHVIDGSLKQQLKEVKEVIGI